MKGNVEITNSEARKLVLYAQGLNSPQSDSIDIVRQLSYVQIDTISVAERAHHHTLLTRNPDYQKTDLDQMMKDKQIFEYWSHAAAFLPIEDYRFSLFQKTEIKKAGKFWREKDPKAVRHVLRRIRNEGPLQSKDFEHPANSSVGWFDWKPTKIALQELFFEGRLMISSREGFQKVYDLTERVLPQGIETKRPTEKQFCRHLVERAIQSQGIVSTAEVGYLRKGIKKTIARVMDEMRRKKEIVPLTIEGGKTQYYSTQAYLESLNTLKSNEDLHILSPFDNMVIQRDRAREIFGFDYIIECYVPEKKRKFGYYVLPVLYRDRFVGRLDPKADRKTGKFYIKKLWLEDDFIPDEEFFEAFAEKINAFSKFCGCYQIVVEKVFPGRLKPEFKKWIKR